jgi:spore maturation protein CgeB
MPETNEKPSFKDLWQRIADRARSGKNVVLTPSTALMMVRELMAIRREAYHHDFPVVLEVWSPDEERIEEVILQSKHQDAAYAAFQLIAERRPKERILLRKRAHVIGRHEPK